MSKRQPSNPKPYSPCGHVHPKLPLASEFIAYLELVWQDQIKRFPELRPAFLRLSNLGQMNGYVQIRLAGIEYRNGERYHDVSVMHDIIHLDPEDVIQSVLHAVVHCLNYDRGVLDVREHRIHDETFRKTAHEVGLDTFWVDNMGYMTKIGEIKNTAQYQQRKHSLKNIKPYRFVDNIGRTIT